MKCRQIHLQQRAPGDLRGAYVGARLRDPVAGHVLQRGEDVVGTQWQGAPLQAAHFGDAHPAGDVGVLAESLLDASPARIAPEVDDRRQQQLDAAGARLARDHLVDARDEGRGPTCCRARWPGESSWHRAPCSRAGPRRETASESRGGCRRSSSAARRRRRPRSGPGRERRCAGGRCSREARDRSAARPDRCRRGRGARPWPHRNCRSRPRPCPCPARCRRSARSSPAVSCARGGHRPAPRRTRAGPCRAACRRRRHRSLRARGRERTSPRERAAGRPPAPEVLLCNKVFPLDAWSPWRAMVPIS